MPAPSPSKSKQELQSKYWCFTLNNYDDDYRPDLVFTYDYIIYGREESSTGTAHLQGYVVFKQRHRLAQLKKLCNAAHWEKARGTPQQNRAYCQKEGDYKEFGTLPNTPQEQGGQANSDKWRDIHALAQARNEGEFLEAYPFESFMYMSKFKSLEITYAPQPTNLLELDNHWFTGPSRSGKSSTARRENPGAYIKPTSSKWWPNYKGEEVVIIDDLGKPHAHVIDWLKNWADFYPFQAETKGSHTGLIRPKKIIITSNYHWDDIVTDEPLRSAISFRFKLRTFGDSASTAPTQGEFDFLTTLDSPPMLSDDF